MNSFISENGQFTNFGYEHLAVFVFIVIMIGYVLNSGKNHWTQNQQRLNIFLICSFGAFMQLFKAVYKYQVGTIDYSHDLPLHLCNIMALVMPFILWYKWRMFWGITFFWIMAGCAQSLFTPTLTESLPHYEAVRYWAVHAVIVLGALYGWYVYGWQITWLDAIRSIVGINLLAAMLYPINIALGANYMYLNGKPPGKTFYDLLGPWPDYILSLELAVIVFFSILLIPFYWQKIKLLLKTI